MLKLALAIEALPPRRRTVLWLRRVQEIPQREVALRLGISEKAVEKHLPSGMQKLARIREP